MSTSPMMLHPVRTIQPHSWPHWLPVLYALVFIGCTSTRLMGGSHTQILVNVVWKAILGTWHWNLTGPVNGACRKVGHFIGYGLVSLIFRNAWHKTARACYWVSKNWLMLLAASLAVVSTFAVACLDEWHQAFVPGRVGSVRDALLDAGGAIVLNGIFWMMTIRRRRMAIERSQIYAAIRSR